MGASTLQLVLCFLLLSAAVVQAVDPPSIVYRSDYRSPDDIFENGFQALGDNDNLYDHVSGASCYKHARNTAFVATTSDKTFAINWTKNSFCFRETAEFFYVYKIRATENFYNAVASLRSIGKKKYTDLANNFEHEEEWLALGGVRNTQIELAEKYRMPDLEAKVEPKRVEIITNDDHYDKAIEGSAANPGPYDRKPKKKPSRFLSLSSFITACFTCRVAPPPLSTAKTEAKISIASLLKNLLLKSQFASSN